MAAPRVASFRTKSRRVHGQFPRQDMTHPGYSFYSAVWYVDNINGLNGNNGHDPLHAVQSVYRAVQLATGQGFPYQCIQLEPSQTAYHDDTGETYPSVIPAALDHLTICSASPLPGQCRHTVIGATDEGDNDGLLYSLAENTRLINLTFLSNETPVYLGTESGHGAGSAVTTGALVKDCVFSTGTTASQPALSLSCTNAIIDGCEIIAVGTTSDCIASFDPFTIKNSTLRGVVDCIHIQGGATYVTTIQDCKFECKQDSVALTGYAINVEVGSNDVNVYDNLFCNGKDGDGTALIGADDNVYSGNMLILGNYFPVDPYVAGGGSADKTVTTSALTTIVAY